MTDTKQISTLPVFQLIYIAIISVFLGGSALAAEMDPYTIQGISVDETAATVPQAQSLAVQSGQRRAFETLLKRLTPDFYHTQLPVIDDESLTEMIASYQVANERTSAQRYLADLTFEFKRPDVRSFLRMQGLPFSEAVGQPLLILPVFAEDQAQHLWEEPNPWMTAWVDAIDYGVRPMEPLELKDKWAQSLLQPVLMPAGDFADIKAITAEEALAMDLDAIEAIQDTYGTAGVIVLRASLRTATDGTLLLDISRQRSGQFRTSVIETYKGSDDADLLMQSAIFDLVGKMQEEWKQANILDFSTESTVAVTTPISGLKQWLAIQDTVKSLPSVSGTKVKDLSVGQAFWHITFLGDINQLAGSLAQKDLQLVEMEGYWTLNPVAQN